MGYTVKYKTVFSKPLNKNANILQYKSSDNISYCNCDKCSKPIIKNMFVIQDYDIDL